MRDIDKIQRQVHFIQTQALVTNGVQPNNNTWIYNRAPEGYIFRLLSASFSVTVETGANGIIAFYDGHEYTRWNQWPGVESRELLGRVETNAYQFNHLMSFNEWECKEYTLGIRSTHAIQSYKVCAIVWYYLHKMNSLETLYYAVIQPRWNRFKKAFATTLGRYEKQE